MQCPFCGNFASRVVDKREVKRSDEIRRRRECLGCRNRFTTYEKIGNLELIVLKRDGGRQEFSREKLKAGISKALEKRPAHSQIDILTDKIERKLRSSGGREFSSKVIGRMVLKELKKLDKIAYLRFASVYRQFKDPTDFAKELESL